MNRLSRRSVGLTFVRIYYACERIMHREIHLRGLVSSTVLGTFIVALEVIPPHSREVIMDIFVR